MPVLPVHTDVTAPEPARFFLASAEAKLGFVPNLVGVLAESPTTLGAFLALGEQFEEDAEQLCQRARRDPGRRRISARLVDARRARGGGLKLADPADRPQGQVAKASVSTTDWGMLPSGLK